MKNYRGKGDKITIVGPSGGLASGQPYMAGDLPVVAETDIPEGVLGSAACTGVYEFPCKGVNDAGGAAIAFGDQIYLDGVELNKDSAGGKPFGNALGVVASGGTASIKVRLGK